MPTACRMLRVPEQDPNPTDRGALRLLVPDTGCVRTISWRPAVLATALAARTGQLHATAIWPSAECPEVAVDPADCDAAGWARRALEPQRRLHRHVSAATWQALRARTVMIVTGRPRALSLTERALRRRLDRPRLVFFSSGRGRGKIVHFVFERDEPGPVAVLKASADPRASEWLEREVQMLAEVRAALPTEGTVRDALPRPALLAERVDDEFIVVEAADPLGDKTFHADRDRALGWLRDFHCATGGETRAWSSDDDDAALRVVRDAWTAHRPQTCDTVCAAVSRRMRLLRGVPVGRCVIHGDFWSGNIATDGRVLRVFDWEWSRRDETPFLDYWTYELNPLRSLAVEGCFELDALFAAAEDRVRGLIEHAGLDGRFAVATLAPVVGHLVTRVRRLTGEANGWENAAGPFLAAVESTIGRSRG